MDILRWRRMSIALLNERNHRVVAVPTAQNRSRTATTHRANRPSSSSPRAAKRGRCSLRTSPRYGRTYVRPYVPTHAECLLVAAASSVPRPPFTRFTILKDVPELTTFRSRTSTSDFNIKKQLEPQPFVAPRNSENYSHRYAGTTSVV
jgi:hypothetical protein